MIKQVAVIVLLVNLLTSQVSTASVQNVNEKQISKIGDILDDAKALLEQLYNTVLGYIMTGHDQINDLGDANRAYRDEIQLQAEFSIQEESLLIDEKLNTIKSLAVAAGKNISSCLETQEPLLEKLSSIFVAELKICISSTDREAEALVTESSYNVDITINKVHELENQLDKCAADDTDCINAVITSAQEQLTVLPMKIKEEVNKASDRSELLKVSIEGCSESTVAGYAKDANSIYLDIINCVNNIVQYVFL